MRPRAAGRLFLLGAGLLAAGRGAQAQFLSDLEPDRPASMEDARPVAYRAFSGSADWTYSIRKDHVHDYGPGFSLLYGPLRGVETGAEVRWVTSPERNANRGIASGDLILHALYGIVEESAEMPALAARVAVQFPTGLDSKGTDLQLAALATRSFDAFRLHANFRYTRLGAVNVVERRDLYEAVLGTDFLPSLSGRTDTILLADVSARSNPVLGAETIFQLEAGARHRIGPQTLIYAGTATEFTGRKDRTRLRLRIGITHAY